MLTGMLAEAWDLYRRSAAHFSTISFVPYFLTAVIVMLLTYARRPRRRAICACRKPGTAQPLRACGPEGLRACGSGTLPGPGAVRG